MLRSAIGKLLVLLVFVLASPQLFGEERDSIPFLKKRLKELERGTTKVRLLEKLKDRYSAEGNYKKALETCRRSRRMAEELGLTKEHMESFNHACLIYMDLGRYEKAVEMYLEGLRMAERMGDTLFMARAYGNMGIIYRRQEQLDKAAEYYQKAGRTFEAHGNIKAVGAVHNNLGNVFKDRGMHAKAYRSHRKSLRIKKEHEKRQALTSPYVNLGNFYVDIFKADNLSERERSLKDSLSEGNDQALLDSAEIYYERALAIQKELGAPKKDMTHTYNGLGEVCFFKKEYPQAVAYYEKSARLADSIGVLPQRYKAELGLAKCYHETGDDTKAYEHHRNYARIRDSVHSRRAEKRIAKMEQRFRVEKHKRKAALLRKEKEKQRALLWSVAGGLGGVLVLLVVLFTRFRVIRRQRNTIEEQKSEVEKAYDQLEATHGELQDIYSDLEERNKEMTDSIEYASLIQKAILPSEADRREVLGEHFVLLKPQATVSGDFFWCHRTHEGAIYWAAVDCTGHGVPGAFMSMIGNNLLDEMLVERGYRDPGVILDGMREGIREKLGGSDQKDGMDMALCKLEKDDGGMQLLFAGANNPLYIVRPDGTLPWDFDPEGMKKAGYALYRKGEEAPLAEDRFRAPLSPLRDGVPEGTFLEVKPDKQAVASEEKAPEPFTTVRIPLRKGDMLYTFSDGFADQFGGEKGKKFRYRPFKSLLHSVSDRAPDEQHGILERTFEEWRQDRDQVDDVCVVGVRVG